MPDTTITPVTGPYAPAGPAGPEAADGTDIFSSDGFLKLLAGQIKGQNPLEPMKDTEFVAQMAQFSQLEQITNLAADTRAMHLSGRLAQGASLVGRTVSYVPEGAATPVTGTVEAVQLGADGRSMSLTVGGVTVDAARVTRLVA